MGVFTAETPQSRYSHAYYNPHKVDTFIDTETANDERVGIAEPFAAAVFNAANRN